MAQPELLPPAAWARLRALLDEALALPPPERDGWLAALGPEDAALKQRLQALLAARPDAASGLDTLPRVETGHFAPAPGRDAPATVGPYRLLRELGHGGMASVWLAERTDLLQSRQVALKLPHLGWSAARRSTLAERLAREREILATLEHPHIARLYDAGVTDDGQAWLALEHVDGEPITHWCDGHQASIEQRIELLLQVCAAVAYAHARLVVHRDLKPSNILVDASGHARLLDFGIAKLLLDGQTAGDTQLTQEGGRLFTPDYAAPEQIAGRPLGVGVDVYALGVLLFELLTGSRPAALLPRAAGGEAPRPSEVAPPARHAALRGDLDTIVLKALKPEPGDRYASVDALAADLRRHLAHQPVLARPDSRGYRLQRFVRRHRVGVAAGAAVVLAVLAGSATALWQAGQAREQRDLALQAKARADREATTARRAQRLAEAQSNLSDFLLSDAATGLSNEAAVAQIERSLLMIRSQYRDDPALRGELLADAAVRLRWVGQDRRAHELFAEAEPLLRAAGAHEGMARILCMRARELAQRGRFDEGRRALAEAATELQRWGDASSYAHAGCLLEEAALSRLAGDPARAVELTERALAIEQAAGRGGREFTSEVLRSLARARLDLGRYAAAADAARQSLLVRERIGTLNGPGQWQTWSLLGMALREGGQPLAALQASGGEGRFDPLGPEQAPSSQVQHALTLAALGRTDDALRVMTRVRAAMAGQGSASELRNVAVHVAQLQIRQGDLAAARRTLDAVEAQFAELRRGRRAAARNFVTTRAQLALASHDLAAAATAIDEIHDILESTRPAPSIWRGWHRLVAQLSLARRQPHEAQAAADRALAISRQLAIDPETSHHVAEDQLLLKQAQGAKPATGEAAAVRTGNAPSPGR